MKLETFETPFNSYSTISIIGHGGSGIVYEVVDDTGQQLALKCLNPTYMTSEKRRRFKNEIRFCEKNTHKNILTILDSGFKEIKSTKCPFYVMSLFSTTLRELIATPIPHEQVLTKFSQILDGVEAAHLTDVWHRDLKPENILYNESSDLLIVADFGIAHFSVQELATIIKTKAKDRLANFQYSAPEQRQKRGNVDHRADIFALGLILNEMFTGDTIQGSGYRTIGSVNEGFAYLDPLVETMVQQNPDSRPHSIDEIKKDLIGRRNDFISRQKLNELKNKVVPVAEVDDPLINNPVEVESFDIKDGYLIFVLNSAPNRDWIKEFQNPRGGHSFTQGICEPHMFEFQGNTVRIRANKQYAQRIIEHFKNYLSPANTVYKALKIEDAQRREREEKERLRRQVQEEQERQELLKQLKL